VVIISIGLFVLSQLFFNYKKLKTLPKRIKTLDAKRYSAVFVFIAVGVVSIATLKYFDLQKKIENLESENSELEEKVSDLENQNEELQIELEEAVSDKENYESLYETLSTNYDNLLERQSGFSSYPSNYSYYNSNNYGSESTDINIPSSISTAYYDGEYIFEPSFENLHFFEETTNNRFIALMELNGYSLSTDKDLFVIKTNNTYCTIDKEWNSVSMIITNNYTSDIESFFIKNGIDYRIEDGAKVYYYTLDNQRYSMLIKHFDASFLATLEKL
jgi:cell division protein FtsL